MSVQRIRLPSVNDIFPKGESQLNIQPSVTGHPAPQLFPSPTTSEPQQSINYSVTSSPNYAIQHHQSPQHVQHVQQLNQPHSGQPEVNVTNGQVLQQPHPYYPNGPIQHHQVQQQPAGLITPTHSPINYIFTNQFQPIHQVPNYHYQQPRMMTPPSSQQKYRINKNTTTARQSNAWSSNDDELLKYLKEVKNLGWREISMYFSNRTANGCQFRWRRIVALSKQHTFHGTIKRKDESVDNTRSNALENLLN